VLRGQRAALAAKLSAAVGGLAAARAAAGAFAASRCATKRCTSAGSAGA
jgi:hypothetical protein